MNYLDVYFSRINHLGETTAERIRNGGIRSFEKWLAESPHTVRNLSVERGIYFDGIILTNKDKEHEKIMFLEVANNVPLLIGDIMNWTLDDGSVEKWIFVQEEKKVNGTFRTFWIVRCNYLMKWIDAQGHLQQSWAYFVSSLDSKIKANFRTWNSLITPQPNKYAELLMPRYPIDRATNFIVEEESWSVIEYDHTSVPGVIYLSLTEGKINSIYDDVKNNIADTDKLAQYKLLVPDEKQVFDVGVDILETLNFTLTKNGIPCEEPVKVLTTSSRYVRKEIIYKEGKPVEQLKTQQYGDNVELVIQLINYPSITQHLFIDIKPEQQEIVAHINGADKIRLSYSEEYVLDTSIEDFKNYRFVLYKTIVIDEADSIKEEYANYLFFPHPKFPDKLLIGILSNESEDLYEKEIALAEVSYNEEKKVWVVKANVKNKLGYVVLGCLYNYNNQNYSTFKIIEIIPLW